MDRNQQTSAPIKGSSQNTSGCYHKEARRSISPQVSLHSFVFGFFIGCVVIYLVGFNHSSMCIGSTCGSPLQESPQNPILDVPLTNSNPVSVQSDHDGLVSKRDSENRHKNRKEKRREKVINVETTEDDSSLKCENRPLHVVILVLTSPLGVMRRNAIRGSWMHDYSVKNLKVTSKFLVGTLELDKTKEHSLVLESKQFNDMLLFDDLKDSYYNLSRKVLLGLNWVGKELGHFDFLIKTDDDSYIQIEKVAQAYKDIGCPSTLYWGYFNGHAFPEPTGKWAETNWFSCPHYLPYAMGGGYMLSERVVRILVSLSDRLILYSNEDVTVGSWLAPFRLLRQHDMRFNVESLTHGCNNRYLITHKDTTRNMYEKFKNLRSNGTLCSPEKEIRPGYNYDWSVPPLDCCNRTKGLDIKYSVYNV